MKVKLSRPLDFLVIADHSDNTGFFPDLFAGKAFILEDPTGKDWYDRVMAGEGVGVALELIGLFSQGEFPEGLTYTPDSTPYKSAWSATVDAQKSSTTLASSRPSSATNGRHSFGATICTASSIETAVT